MLRAYVPGPTTTTQRALPQIGEPGARRKCFAFLRKTGRHRINSRMIGLRGIYIRRLIEIGPSPHEYGLGWYAAIASTRERTKTIKPPKAAMHVVAFCGSKFRLGGVYR